MRPRRCHESDYPRRRAKYGVHHARKKRDAARCEKHHFGRSRQTRWRRRALQERVCSTRRFASRIESTYRYVERLKLAEAGCAVFLVVVWVGGGRRFIAEGGGTCVAVCALVGLGQKRVVVLVWSHSAHMVICGGQCHVGCVCACHMGVYEARGVGNRIFVFQAKGEGDGAGMGSSPRCTAIW
jgi:hypothetical protein